MTYNRLALSLVFCGAATVACWGQADNTKVNKRDRDKAEKTADQQKMNAPDRELTRKIRKSIVDDATLSTYAHNVKIISQDGMVTLKGPVRSAAEKQSVVAKAVAVTGKADKVTDEISIAAK
jgi:osmotically-inducible protein OsmY